jgi:eukaryotic-like serine/threonine-protein kinase
MNRLKHLILEAHRRSLWQVLGVYLVSGWVVLQVVGELTRTAGLPPWVPPFALVLLLIGLPIVLATAVVQEGGPGGRTGPGDVPAGAPEEPASVPPPSPERSFLQRHLTWKRSLLGGAAAFTLLALLAGAYLASWATGIGPAASLAAQGQIEEGDLLVLADFSSPEDDPALGGMVTDALRMDLQESPLIRVMEVVDVRGALSRMQASADAPLTPDLAREVAFREGAKAVLEGSVAPAGAGYVFTATLRHAETERSLASFRETARSDEDVIPALDRLSRRIRERAGESLRSINAGPGLERVTTSSLPALRLYTEALRAFDRTEYRTVIELLEEAVELDPEFAMAWRALSVSLGNTEWDRVREREAAEQAYRHRLRLSERERYLTEANYHRRVTGDQDATAEAYRRVLRSHPDDRSALNNLGAFHADRGEWDRAAGFYERAVETALSPSSVAFGNLIRVHLRRGLMDEARAVLGHFAEWHPESLSLFDSAFWVHFIAGDEEGAREALEGLRTLAEGSPQARVALEDRLARLALWRGRLAQAREHMGRVEEAATELGPGSRLVQRLFRAHGEIVMGEAGRGLRLLREAEAEGLFAARPPSDQWHFFHANLLGMAGRPDEAEAVLRRFEEEVPEEFHEGFHTRNESARFYVAIQRGQAEEAIGIIQHIRAAHPCRECYAKRMGWALVETGRLQEAVEEWETALAWRDQIHALHWHLGQNLWILQRIGPVYEALGEGEKALAHYRRMVDLWAGADPELQPRVREWRERIEALERAG